jgi:hypothetical protein
MLFNLLSGALFGIPIALDYLWASWDKQRQCLHDKAVVRRRSGRDRELET